MDREWLSIGLAAAAWVPNVLLGIDRWVHRQSEVSQDHIGRIRQLETDWQRMLKRQSDTADKWQVAIGTIELKSHAIELQLARIEEHLRFVDKRQE